MIRISNEVAILGKYLLNARTGEMFELEDEVYSLAQRGLVRLGLDIKDNKLEAVIYHTPSADELLRLELQTRGWKYIHGVMGSYQGGFGGRAGGSELCWLVVEAIPVPLSAPGFGGREYAMSNSPVDNGCRSVIGEVF